jgi:hypothetical protein
MGKFFKSVRGPLNLGRSVKALATVAGVCTLLAPGLSLACDDDYAAPTGWAPYAEQQPTVVMVDPRVQYDRYEDRHRERAARAYWYWRGRHREHEYRHHHRGQWD